jgi:hypothetical protein
MNRKYCMVILLVNMLFIESTSLRAVDVDTKQLFNIIKTKADSGQTLYLSDLTGVVDDFDIPDAFKNVLTKIAITVKSKSYNDSTGTIDFVGTVSLNGFIIDITFHREKKPGGMQLTLMTPQGIDFKKLFPDLADVADVMSKLALGKGYFIFSNYNYTDPTLGIRIYPGFNIGAVAELTGILKDCQTIIDTLKKADFIFIDNVSAVFSAFIAKKTILNSTLGVILPLRIGIDFTKKPFNLKDPILNVFIRPIWLQTLV